MMGGKMLRLVNVQTMSAPAKLEKIAYNFYGLGLYTSIRIIAGQHGNNTRLAAIGHHHFAGE